MNADLSWGFDTEPHTITTDFDNGDGDVLTYDDRFILLTAEHEHGIPF